MGICGRTEHSILYKIEQRTVSETSFLFFSAIDTISKRKWEGNIPSLKIIDSLILSPSYLFSLFLNEDNNENIEILFPKTPHGDKLIITLFVSLPLQGKVKGIISLEELEVSILVCLEMMMKDLRSDFETFEANHQNLQKQHLLLRNDHQKLQKKHEILVEKHPSHVTHFFYLVC